MFDLSFFSDTTPVASGWTNYSTDKFFPRLATRKPQTHVSSDEEMPSPSGSGTASDESSSDEAPEPIVPLLSDAVTRMESESSGEESLPDVTVSSLEWSVPLSSLIFIRICLSVTYPRNKSCEVVERESRRKQIKSTGRRTGATNSRSSRRLRIGTVPI